MDAQDGTLDRIRNDAGVRAAVRGGHDTAADVHVGIAVSFELFLDEVLVRVVRRLERAGLEPSIDAVREVLSITAFEDVYLVVACDTDVAGAWRRLIETHAQRIDDLAHSIGMRERSASLGRDLLGDLAEPPSSGVARTRLGTFDGSGSLFAWLAVILRRRGATRARRKTKPPAPVEPASLDDRHASAASDPFAALVDAEEGTRIVHALQGAWRALSTREQLALHFRFGESLKLKDIGTLLGLSESGTSRLVAGALATLRKRVRLVVKDGVIPPARMQLWSALWRAVGSEGDPEAGPS